jgi:hypothetical protein
MQKPVAVLQPEPEAQSFAEFWQGNAHFENCTLHFAVPQFASLVHGSASGPGVAIAPPPAAGAIGAAVGAGCAG